MRKKISDCSENQPASIREAAMEEKRLRILSAACTLFGHQGIESTSMEQIAHAAAVGPATLYRYFPTKQILACQVAANYWLDLKSQYLPDIRSNRFEHLTGKEQLSEILFLFITLYDEHTAFLGFLADFDTYIKTSEISDEQLRNYEDIIISLKNYAQSALERGLKDHTLHSDADAEELYFTIFHCMLSTTQKMALNGNLLSMDQKVSGRRQLILLTELLLRGLS